MTAPAEQIRVMVVDDDSMSRDVLAVQLEASGYSVQCAPSGEDAIGLLQTSAAPHLILSDLQMPGLAGNPLALLLRKSCGPSTMLLAMSGSGPRDASISRFDGFLMKPFAIGEISAALARRSPPMPHGAPSRPKRAPGTPPAAARKAVPSRLTSLSVDASNSSMNAREQESDSSVHRPEDPPPAGSALNERIYMQLADCMPVPQLHQMYAMCLRDARERIASMRRLTSQKDQVQFARQAHAIKGGCGMLGASELYEMATRLESKGIFFAGPSRNVNPLDEFCTACDRLERILGARASASSPEQ